METGKKLAEKTERRFKKKRAGNISQLNALLKGNRWTRTTLVVSFGLFFPPSLFIPIFSILNKCCPEALAQILFSNVQPWCWCPISPRGIFSFTPSQPTSVSTIRQRIWRTQVWNHLSVFPPYSLLWSWLFYWSHVWDTGRSAHPMRCSWQHIDRRKARLSGLWRSCTRLIIPPK